MVRRVPTAATRAKISASLKGNKNAFQGGPKRKLTAREKVANINSRAAAKKMNLSDEQLVRRRKVAQRLRVQARKEEAGQSSRSTPLPTPDRPSPQQTARDTEARARAKGSIPQGDMKANTGGTADRVNKADKRKALEVRQSTLDMVDKHIAKYGNSSIEKKITELMKSDKSTDLFLAAALRKRLIESEKIRK